VVVWVAMLVNKWVEVGVVTKRVSRAVYEDLGFFVEEDEEEVVESAKEC